MARLHSRKKGVADSKRPSRLIKPEWCKYTPEEVEKLVVDLYKRGETPSKIGLILRDSYGIPLVKAVTGKKIKKILEENNLRPSLPEDLVNLVKKVLRIKKHLDEHKKDLNSKVGLQRTEAKIYRLIKYYKKVGVLPEDFKYRIEEVKLLIQ